MKTDNDKIDLRRYLTAICQKGYYYVVAFVIFMAFAIMYVHIEQQQYQFHSTILIENEEDSNPKPMGGGMMQMLRTFSVGGFGSTSVDNEIVLMQSHELIKNTVKELELNRTYILKEGLVKKILYENSPIIVTAPALMFDTLQTSIKLKIEIGKEGEVKLTATEGFLSKSIAEVKSVKLPIEVKTKYGLFKVLPTEALESGKEYNLQVIMSNNDAMTEYFERKIIVDYATKKADGITFELKDVNKERGCDILNTLMSLYNKKRLERKNEKAKYEVEFTNERITLLGVELSDAEKRVEQFKTDNNLSNIGAEMGSLISQESEVRQVIVTQQSQIMIFDMILKFLSDPQNTYSLLPMSEGLSDKAATEVLAKYNELLLERMKLERSAKNSNIAMQDLDSQINAMRKVVVANVQRLKDNVAINLTNITTENDKFATRLSAFPKLEREYYNLMRDKELKNDLYVFLLEKRENSSLKLASNLSPGFIIDKAYADFKPLTTQKYIAFLIAFVLALIVPTILILFLLRKENLINYVFDFPKFIDENNIFTLSIEKDKYMQDIRKLRSYLLVRSERKTFFVTSNVKNENKAMIIVDMAQSISNAGKKTLIIELDNSNLCKVLGVTSNDKITQFINGDNMTIFHNNNIDYIGRDTIDLCVDDILMNDRFIQMVNKFKEEYACIFINIPIISDILATTERIGDLLYIVEAGKMKRNELTGAMGIIDKAIFILKK